jgi:predicted phage terminase large subunit-like protein
MQLSYPNFIQIERDLGRRSFKHFAKMAWHVIEPGTPLMWGWALEAECDHLQAVTEGKFNRLLMNVPPGMSKSTLLCVLWPAWEWIERPWLRYLGTAHNVDLAIRDNMKCRRLVQSDWYQERWPMKFMSDNDAKLSFENDQTGWRKAMAFTSLTGSRGDRVLIDDPLSVMNGNSAADLASAEFTFREAVPTRVNNDASAIVVIMQRLNEGDTSGIIIKDFPNYVHLCLPMEFEPERRCVTPIFTDPRTVEGELLFPERFGRDTVEELKRSLGTYGAAGQLQQRPAPRGGGIFKSEWWKLWYGEEPRCQYRIIYADTASKKEEQNDYSVFQCWGIGWDNKVYLLDQIRDKWEAPELLVQSRAFWNKHNAIENGPLRIMKVEDKSSGTQLIQYLERGDADHRPIPVEGIPRSRDKVSRAHDVTPRIEAGLIYLPGNAPWLSDYMKEFATFPNGANDDMIDPTIDAINELGGAGFNNYSGLA